MLKAQGAAGWRTHSLLGLVMWVKSYWVRKNRTQTLEPVNQSSTFKPDAWLTDSACPRGFEKSDPLGVEKGADYSWSRQCSR